MINEDSDTQLMCQGTGTVCTHSMASPGYQKWSADSRSIHHQRDPVVTVVDMFRSAPLLQGMGDRAGEVICLAIVRHWQLGRGALDRWSVAAGGQVHVAVTCYVKN